MRLDTLSAIFAGSIAVYFAYWDNTTSPGAVGFVLASAGTWVLLIQHPVKKSNKSLS